MAEQTFRVQFLRGTEAENEIYIGRDGELTVDKTKKSIRVHDGSTPGGSLLATFSANSGSTADSRVKILVNDFTAGNWTVPSGITVKKALSDSALEITHNKNAYPVHYITYSTAVFPTTVVIPTATKGGLQIIDANTVILIGVSSYTKFETVILF